VTRVLDNTQVLIAGAGIMGSGIAQVAALAGHPVLLFDNRQEAAESAKTRLARRFDELVDKGKFSAAIATQALARIKPVHRLDSAGHSGIAIEAIVEDLDKKREMMKHLESIVADDCILASNTSSFSISALANGLRHPERLVGMHFFNPAAIMKLVEIVSGIHTDRGVAEAVFSLAEAWGKVAVHARSTPGFIVNRIARPFYAESLALLQEQAASVATIDACMRGAGFRMGPCELMDLIGQDTNLAVTQSVYEANFYDKRYQPSTLQQALVEAGMLGRKTDRGFYRYPRPDDDLAGSFNPHRKLPPAQNLRAHGVSAFTQRLTQALDQQNIRYQTLADSDWNGLQLGDAQLRETDGRPASQLGSEVAVFDRVIDDSTGAALAWSHSSRASEEWIKQAGRWLEVCGFQARLVADTPGLVVARTLAMLINEAADAVQQGVCSEADADRAMKLGVNYPAGPFEWLADWNPRAVVNLLDRLDDYYRGERYRVSPWLRHEAWRSRDPA
jgi:3-hydroxybutyryl-CoA dehydrogenase